MRDEVDEDQDAVYFVWNSNWRMAEIYQSAKEVLEEYENPEEEKAEQVQVLEQLWQRGFSLAAYQLGKCWRDGRGVLPDDEQAELWFRRAADAGYDFAQYALGKLLQSQNRTDEAVSWYEKAAAQENSCAAYRLGKLYLEGKDVPKDVPKAVAYLTESAQQGNQYAQYALENCTSLGRVSNRIGSRPGRISMNRRNRETSTPPSSWSTSIRRAGPMCSWRPPGCSTI
ncbi:MAG: tetratricopeptide repeat protein [Dysosmobacter sp.]